MAFASHLHPSHPSAPLWAAEASGGLEAAACSSSSEPSPSSEEWGAPAYRRLEHERPPLMKRLALGLRRPPDDDDATPLVPDTPATPPTPPAGYINEPARLPRRPHQPHQPHQPPPELLNSCQTGSSGGSSSGEESGGSARSGNNNARAEPELASAPWFQAGIPREIALEVLGAQAPGAFLVRASTTQHECLALSLRVPRDFAPLGIAHYLIVRTPRGYKIKGFTKEFRSLSALVTHHSVMPELLPVPLRLPRAPARPRAPDLEPLERLTPRPPPPPQRCPADLL